MDCTNIYGNTHDFSASQMIYVAWYVRKRKVRNISNVYNQSVGHPWIINTWEGQLYWPLKIVRLSQSVCFVWWYNTAISCQFQISYNISLLLLTRMSQHRIIIIFTVKFEINNIAFTIKGQSHCKMNSTTPSGHAINICILHRLCFDDRGYLLKILVTHNQM